MIANDSSPEAHIIGGVIYDVHDVNIPNHPNYNHTFCERRMYTVDAKLLTL